MSGKVALMDLKNIYFNGTGNAYCDIVDDGTYLYLSGLISEDLNTGNEAYGDITFETKRILDNLEEILSKYGSDMEHVIKTEVLLSDFSERDEMNVEYKKHFSPEHMPARLCYGNVGLHGKCKVEIQVTAVRK